MKITEASQLGGSGPFLLVIACEPRNPIKSHLAVRKTAEALDRLSESHARRGFRDDDSLHANAVAA